MTFLNIEGLRAQARNKRLLQNNPKVQGDGRVTAAPKSLAPVFANAAALDPRDVRTKQGHTVDLLLRSNEHPAREVQE